tara:strand:- start:242 stop:505 length:264 start_codon:yes stop_codon:yes gene_type:complete
MNAKERGFQKAYENLTKRRLKELGFMDNILDKIPAPCKGKIHNRAGICPKCKTNFVKWSCNDDNGNFLLEVFLPYYCIVSSPLTETK